MKRCTYSSNPSVFFGTGKISAGELDPISSTQRCEQTGETTKKSNKDNKKTRKHNLYGKSERIRVYQLQEEKLRKIICIVRYRSSQRRNKKNQFTMSNVDKKRNNCLKLQKRVSYDIREIV